MRWLNFPRVLGIVVCLYLLGMAAIFGVLSAQSHHFVKTAERTTGTVVRLVPRAPLASTRDPNPGARSVSLAPEVRYTVGGTTYTYIPGHGRFRQRLRPGDPVVVLYDPNDPNIARLRGEGQVLLPVLTGGFAASAIAVALVLIGTRRLGVRERRPRPNGPQPVRVPHSDVV